MSREPNPRTEPLGVLFVCSQSTAKSLEAVAMIDTASLLERAIEVERRCQARSAVLDALVYRLREVAGVALAVPDRDGTDSRPSGTSGPTSRRQAKKVGQGVSPSRTRRTP